MYKYIVQKLSYVQIYTVELLKIIRTQYCTIKKKTNVRHIWYIKKYLYIRTKLLYQI